MPVLKAFRNCRVSMYPRDHSPPHVHLEFRDGDRCRVAIRTLSVRGAIRPVRKIEPALAWIESHREYLLACWKEIVS